MPIDSLFIGGLCVELNAALSGARIDKVYMPRRDQLVLNLRSEAGALRLMLSVGAYPAVFITALKYENPDFPPMFCMLLRKQMSSGRILSVSQPNRERIVVITFTAADEMGFISEKKLICELMGGQKNIILVNADGIITACLRNSEPEKSERAVLPGLSYRLPAPPEKPLWLDMPLEALREITAAMPADGEKYLSENMSGLTFSLARQAAAENDPAQWLFETAHAVPRPFICLKDGEPADISAVKPACEYTEAHSFCAALDMFYGEKSRADGIKSKKSGVEKSLLNSKKRIERKLAEQERELTEARDREKYKIKADLITANLGMIQKGQSKVRVTDYFSPDMPETVIELDPLETPQKNAQKLYKKYARLKNGEQHLKEHIEKGRAEHEYVESLLYSLALAENMKEAEAVRAEATDAGLLKKDGKKTKPAPSAPRRFVTPGGFELLCGRNNRENDELTNRIASKRDIWFHARGIAGSHVILITAGGVPQDADIRSAAALAAYYSASSGVTVTVDYTLVKNVKKPNGARPGAVNYFEYKSVLIKPELPKGEEK